MRTHRVGHRHAMPARSCLNDGERKETMRNDTRNSRNLATELILGAAAGAVATWLMDLATTALYERQPEDVTRRENEARGDETAYATAAAKTAGFAGVELNKEQRQTLGTAIHWTLGTFAGAGYGALRHTVPNFRLGSGLAYGFAFWLVMDEAALTLLGVAPPPQRFPWQTHARGLAGHLVLGASIEAAFDAADGLAALAD